MTQKDFSYESGERQTSVNIGEIRKDHSSRYLYAIDFLQKHARDLSQARIGDIFCGNGYGTWMIASSLLVKEVIGIDGSQDAIEKAKVHYFRSNTKYEVSIFPFSLKKEAFEAIICYESIEHVNDYRGLLETLVSALKSGGFLFVSTPNEVAIPFAINKNWFGHHVKHFMPDEVIEMSEVLNMQFVGGAGQDVYQMSGQKVVGIDNKLAMTPEEFRSSHQFSICVFKKVC